MARRKKTEEFDEGIEFDTLFGMFHSASVEQDKKPMFKIVVIGEEYAQPCRCCGEQPALHIANFKEKENYPSNVYVCCSHCSSCDGNWYPDRETALAEWNNRNFGSKPRDKSKEDMYDFVNKIMKNFKIPD